MPTIPKKTADKIAEKTPKGQRHTTAREIAISMIGNGCSRTETYQTLRKKFEDDVTDDELNKLVDYAVSLKPQPTVYGDRAQAKVEYQRVKSEVQPQPKPVQRTPEEHAKWWLSGSVKSVDEFVEGSQIKPPLTQSDALVLMLELLYEGAENLNIVLAYEMREDKAQPKGPGRILTRDKWIEYVREKGMPEHHAGAWFRFNPCSVQGSGSAGSVTDSDIVSFKWMLLESDVLPLEIQLALYSKLKIPIGYVVMSGGKSAHALVRLDAKDAEDYSQKCRRILAALSPFGIDQGNKNPSRLSRLPGAKRTIGVTGDGIQRLLWLNPGKQAVTNKEIDAFVDSLLMPALEEKPFKRLVQEALPRYQEMMDNKGKLGVPTGFIKFDAISGGLKPGGYTLIGANTGVGKSTIALNMLNAALKANIGVVLFTMEMTKEDITDMMFSLNCRINRNVFNTGEFSDGDIQKITVGCDWMKNLPLWVDDEPAITMASMRRKVLALKSENKIGLAVVDYAQLALTDDRPDNREQQVAAIALGIRLLSREANLPIILLSQLNDDGRVRESRKLAHEATNVFKMERKSLDDPNITLFIDKGRKIPATPLKLYLKAEYCLITEASGVEERDVPKYKEPYPD